MEINEWNVNSFRVGCWKRTAALCSNLDRIRAVLQLVQKAIERLLRDMHVRAHVTPVFSQLHLNCIPIDFKSSTQDAGSDL